MRKYLTPSLTLITAIMTTWVIMLIANRVTYFHTDINPVVTGKIQISATDIDDQCGLRAKNRNDVVEYKLTPTGELIYLCPLEFWPVQKEVRAVKLSVDFRNSLPPQQSRIINQFYPDTTEAMDTGESALPLNSVPLI